MKYVKRVRNGLAAMGVVAAGVAAATWGLTTMPREACSAQEKVSFADDVAPVLREHCVSCHHPGGPGYDKSGLDLSTWAGLMKGTKYGPVVTPGDADTSNLMWLLDWRATPELRMPHGKKKLSICDRDTIRTWIYQGAKDN